MVSSRLRRMFRKAQWLSLLATTAIFVSPTVAGAKPVNDEAITPQRSIFSPSGVFTGLLDAPTGDAFFNAPSPLPGRPGDVIWAAKSPQPCQDLFGALTGTCNIPIPIVRGTNRAVEVWRILLHSMDRAGRSRAVSAVVVADPPTAANSRVMVTQHGWAGMGDRCGILGGQFGGGFANLGNAVQNYLSDGWVFVAPSAPGAAAPGLTTNMVSGDSARSLIDAAWATHLFTGARREVVMHGHSFGGMMVTGVGGEVTTYAPELIIRGLVVNAAYGLTGPSVPGFDGSRGAVIDKPFDYQSAVTKAGTLALVAQYSQAYAPSFKASNYLTKIGLRYMKIVTELCSGPAVSAVIGLSWKELFKKTPEVPDIGSISRLSKVPAWFVVADGDEIVEPLMSYHAYVSMCSAGQPTYLSVVEGKHGTSLGVLSPRDTSGLKGWIADVASGNAPPGACAAMQPKMASWYPYSATQVAQAFNVRMTSKDKVSVSAKGACRVGKSQGVSVRPDSACELTIKVTRGTKTIATQTVTVQTRA